MSLENQNTEFFPWENTFGDKNYQKEPWILNKGKESITITRNIKNKGFFYLQKNDEKILSLNLLQTKSTYNQLIQLGYKLLIAMNE